MPRFIARLLRGVVVNGKNLGDCTTAVAAVAVAGVVAAAAIARADAPQFASGVNIVEVYASVADRSGEPIAGLTAADFIVKDDGEVQRITAFAAGEFPLSVALAIDRSFSMSGDRLATAKAAGRAFIDALRPADQVMLVAIGSETQVAAPLSTAHESVITALDRLDAWGTTPLYDSILSSIEAIEPAKGRRALVLLSDGVDRFSRATAADVLEQARRRDVILYPVAIGRNRPPLFAELAGVTGGRSFFVSDTRQLERTLGSIARELRLQYLLGYSPSPDPRPGWHAIDVQVNRPGAIIRARDGYAVIERKPPAF